MSTLSIKYYTTTLSYLAHRRDRQFSKSMKLIKIRASRRQIKKIIRSIYA